MKCDLISLEDKWRLFWDGEALPVPAIGVLTKYDEAVRAYHNAGHIVDCLRQYEGYCAEQRQNTDRALVLAIFFHDVIYDPRATNNEVRSADAALSALADLVSAETLADVERLILVTDHKRPAERVAEQVMVDVDLSILGREQRDFDVYERAIRVEYAHVPEEQFRAGRAKVLRHFLNRARLYNTDYFFKKYEAMARQNLTRSLACLAE